MLETLSLVALLLAGAAASTTGNIPPTPSEDARSVIIDMGQPASAVAAPTPTPEDGRHVIIDMGVD